MNNAQLINQDSGNFEYYTPIEIVEAARDVMGSIDLDPASSDAANERVQADRIYTIEDDGLSLRWHGKVWLNHPFSRKNNPLWVDKLLREYRAGRMKQSCNITYAGTSETWGQKLMEHGIQCFLSPRTNYYLPDGTKKRGVTKGSMVTYLGPYSYKAKFAAVFANFGVVK